MVAKFSVSTLWAEKCVIDLFHLTFPTFIIKGVHWDKHLVGGMVASIFLKEMSAREQAFICFV